MLYHLLAPLADEFILFNVFRYITFRAFCAFVTALVLHFLIAGRWIAFLRARQFGQVIRDDGPKSHIEKRNTPTMGGVLVVACLAVSVLLWGDLTNPYVWTGLAVLLGFGAVGLVDDLSKIRRKDAHGFRGSYKIVIEAAICLAAALYLYGGGHLDTRLHVPFFKDFTPDLGAGYLYFTVVVIAGCANAVNLTDGLDGLVTVPSITSFFSFGVLAYAAGHRVISDYLQVAYVPRVGETAVLCGAAIGALIGFLWYNAHPADIFMGDVGALGIGGLLGTVSLMTKNEILLTLIGGVFVIETVSVIAQVASFKLTGRRVLRMAPIHHHFELTGWKESKVIVRFWIVSFIFAVMALVTLKLR